MTQGMQKMIPIHDLLHDVRTFVKKARFYSKEMFFRRSYSQFGEGVQCVQW